MKKILLALALASTIVFSQDLAFGKGKNSLNFGWAWGGNGQGAAIVWDHGAINDMFSFGGDLILKKYNHSWNGVIYPPITAKYRLYEDFKLSPNFRFAFHLFGIPALNDAGERHDVYAGVKLGANLKWRKYTGPGKDYYQFSDGGFVGNDDGDIFNWDIIAGYRFYVTEKFNLWAEFNDGGLAVGVGFGF
jgi:hypothetical protein